jgi:deoxycytidylate deaminase
MELSAKQEHHLSIAAKAATKSKMRARVGAYVDTSTHGRGVGWNQAKTHPLLRVFKYDDWCGLHAEMHACLGAEVKGCTIYVVRLLKNGRWGMAKPCVHCHRMLKELGVKKVVYSNGIGDDVSGEVV